MVSALDTGWLFLLRAPEYCYFDGGTRGYCLRLGDAAFYDVENREVAFQDAKKALTMPIVIRRSKTNQARAGYTRRINCTGLEIDAVDSVASMLQSRSTEWLADPCRALFELKSGKAVSSTQVSEILKQGAVDLGLGARRYATHLLR